MARKLGLRSSVRDWVFELCTRLLTKPLKAYEQRVPNNLENLKKTLRKGDVILVEGNQRVSQVIRYLTQSSWSHSALYIGDELLHAAPEVMGHLNGNAPVDLRHLLVEAVVGEGVVASPLEKYKDFNIRVCRPKGLRPTDVEVILGEVISHLGHTYDVQHIVDLARYFMPVSIVPRRWRKAALHLGKGSDREVICSSMIARAFARVGYPIVPQVRLEDVPAVPAWWKRIVSRNGRRFIARFREQDPSLITPRDFDLSPYFEIVKFNHLADPNFDYRRIVWEAHEAQKSARPEEVDATGPRPAAAAH